MKIDDEIRDENPQFHINREEIKLPASSSSKIDKYEYLTGGVILPSNQRQIIHKEKLFKNKQKQMRINAKSK